MKRIISVLLLTACLFSAVIQPMQAARPETKTTATAQGTAFSAQQTRTASYKVSEAGLAFIADVSDGYSDYKIGVAESAVNSFIKANSLSLKQEQFDALVDFTLEYGSGILNDDYRYAALIISGQYTETQLASAFCAWVKENGSFSQEKLDRRLRQIKLFLYGSYDGVCYVDFRYVVFHGNGGSLNDNTVICYALDSSYKDLPTASRRGSHFAGWFTEESGGTHIYNTDKVTGNLNLYAQWSATEVKDPNGAGSTQDPAEGWPELPELKISESCINYIKTCEGFAEYPVWDYGQYSVGYGTRYDPDECPIQISSPITEEEADYLLRNMLVDFEVVVDKFLTNATVEHSASQYDAIVSFTYNLGQQWMKDKYQICQYILHGGYTEMEFVNAIGKWCNAGGTRLPGLVTRRIDEANMYLNGDYTHRSCAYLGMAFQPNGGGCAEDYLYYKTGEKLGQLPVPTREGYRFVGWYDKVSGGTLYTAETVAPAAGYKTLYARWEVGQELPPVTEDVPDEGDGEETPPTDPEETPEPEEDPLPDEEQPSQEISFTDVPKSAWYYEYVTRAVQEGLFSGVSENRFSPDGSMTRAMLATVLYRIAGQPEATGSVPFTDVPKGQWYSDAICWAYSEGIVNGVSQTRFGLNDYVTREQLTVMLLRYAQSIGADCTQRAELNGFRDAAKVAAYAQEAMSWACAVGILNGDGDRLNPQGNATRAQCAKMIVCFLELLPAQTGELTETAEE